MPSPIYVFVQVALGAHQSVNTKKKVRVDQANRVAAFTGEKVSVVKTSNGIDEIPVKFVLYAFYNQKEKAIGAATVDLVQFMASGSGKRGQLSKVVFGKCFDKGANLVFEVRVKDMQARFINKGKMDSISEVVFEE